MTTFVNIKKALDNALMSNDFGGLPAFLENIDYDTNTDQPFLNAFLLPAQPEQVDLGSDGTDRHSGVYQIDINYKTHRGVMNHMVIADAINLVFRSGADLTWSEVCVRIEATGITPIRIANGWAVLSVSVDWFSTTKRIS